MQMGKLQKTPTDTTQLERLHVAIATTSVFQSCPTLFMTNLPYRLCQRFCGIFRHKHMAGKSLVCWVLSNKTKIPVEKKRGHSERQVQHLILSVTYQLHLQFCFAISLNSGIFVNLHDTLWTFRISAAGQQEKVKAVFFLLLLTCCFWDDNRRRRRFLTGRSGCTRYSVNRMQKAMRLYFLVFSIFLVLRSSSEHF